VNTLKYYYYVVMFLFTGWLFDVALTVSDNWETCQNLFALCRYYEIKMESITFD
jgi:hypothetical protein